VNVAKAKAPGSGAESGKGGMGSKQKNQLIVLIVLSLLLAGVVVHQFSGSETEYEVAALAADAMTAPLEPEQPAVAVVEDEPRAEENPVLSQPPPEEGLERNPFANFWNRDDLGEDAAERLPPPQIAVGLTLPASTRPLAVIDGSMRFVGETIQGWTLAEVRPRAVVLQSPSEERLVVEMPVHLRVVTVPATDAP
jgi:hypothetical protein